MQSTLPASSHESTLQVLTVFSAAEAADAAAQALWNALQRFSAQGEVTLLLSGGSATQIYVSLVPYLSQSEDLSWLHLGQVDERWAEPDHDGSNMRQIQASGLVQAVLQAGGTIDWMLTGASGADTVEHYSAWIEQRREQDAAMVAVVGIGADGHTAGIFPQTQQSHFSLTFPPQQEVVKYTATNASEYPDRITLTPWALSQMNWVTGLVLGESKRAILERLLGPEEPISTLPAQILMHLPGKIFTDQEEVID